jgi:hypothetical protein
VCRCDHLQGSSDTTVALVFSLQGVAFFSFNMIATLLAYTTVSTAPTYPPLPWPYLGALTGPPLAAPSSFTTHPLPL